MISRLKQRYFSNNKLYTLLGMAVLLIMAVSAWYSKQQRETSFKIRLQHLHQLQVKQLEQIKHEAARQVDIAVGLIATDPVLISQLQAAAMLYQQHGAQADLSAVRQQMLPLVSAYWNTLLPYGASQLHLHLAPDAFTLLRAHKPERHSDSLANVRPLIMHSLNTGLNVTGVELGRHGLGLRAVVPVKTDSGAVQAAVELGFDMQTLFTLRQLDKPVKSGTDDSVQMALLVKPAITKALNTDMRKFWYETEFWSTSEPAEHLRRWLNDNKVPQYLGATEQYQFTVDHQTYLVSAVPWALWDQADKYTPQLAGIVWQDISSQLNEHRQENRRLLLKWALATVLLLMLGFVLVAVLRRQAQQEVDEQQALLRQSEQKLSALYQLSPLPILLNRFSDGAYIEANAAMVELVGYTPQELTKLSYWDLTPEHYAQAEQQQLASLTETGRYGPYVKQYRHKSGELIDIELNGVLFTDADGEKFIWSIIKDIREVKRVEKLKDDFVSTVSHELRTPLTSISGSLGLVLGGAGGTLSPKAEKLLTIARKNSLRLNLLINDLLDIEKLMAGKMRFDETAVSLPRLLHEALEQHQPYAQQHSVTLRLNTLPDVQLWIDAARIQQVLANFLSNAVKFSPAHSEVVLGAKLDGDTVKIWVKDQGPGISVADQQQLFKRFSQLSHTDSQPKGGTGLGLAISREIALQARGNVGVESGLGEGATFWLELPVYQPAKQSGRQDAILVVEDDADTALVLCEFLREQHYAADWVQDSKTAWQRLTEQAYVAITLDLKLRDESGADFFLRLRDNQATANLPVLIVSAFVEKGKLQLAALANAMDWLEKPVSPDLLNLKLNRLLSQLPGENKYKRILHIEDDSDIVTIMRLQLDGQCDYCAACNLAEATAVLAAEKFDLILLDLGLPDGNGMALMPAISDTQGDIPVVIFSAQDVNADNKARVQAVFSKSRISTEVLAKYLKNILN